MQAALCNRQSAIEGGLARHSICPDRSGLPPEQLWWATPRFRRSSKVLCAHKIPVVPKKKNNLRAEAERRFLRAIQDPLEGLSFSKDDFAALLSKYDHTFAVGDMVEGTICHTDKNGALVDVGGKAPAFLPTAEASLLSIKSLHEIGLAPGVKKEFYILNMDDLNARMVLSLKKIQLDLAWDRCRELQVEDAIVRSSVLGVNRGGLLVNIEGIRGFVPLSHLPEKNNLEEYKGKVIPLRFIEVAEEESRLIMSYKLALLEYQVSSMSIGQVVEAVVTNVKPFGAFLSFGRASGLLHISEISHARVTDIHAVLQPGDKLKALVINCDLKKGKINLSTKKLEPSMGDMLRNPQLVYDSAEDMAHRFMQRLVQQEALATEAEEMAHRFTQSLVHKEALATEGESTVNQEESAAH